MSAVNKPNKNFYNETMTHTPFKEVVSGSMKSLYDKFMTPKDGKARVAKQKLSADASIKTKGFEKWFTTVIILFCGLLVSCATKHVECDSYSTIQFIERDTFCIESQHVHIDEESLCSYFDDIEIIAVDTIEIQIPTRR